MPKATSNKPSRVREWRRRAESAEARLRAMQCAARTLLGAARTATLGVELRSWRGVAITCPVSGMETLVEQVGADPVHRVVGFMTPGCTALAAAAPAMLATLRDMDRWLANTHHDGDHPWRMSIRAAIAKAEGRA